VTDDRARGAGALRLGAMFGYRAAMNAPAPITFLTCPNWIAGAPTPAGAGERLPVIDPATEETVGDLIEADAATVDAAVTAARAAFDHGPWPRLPVAERQRILRAIADAIDANTEELARLESLHTGMALAQIKGMHLPRAALNFRFFAEYIGQMRGTSYTDGPGLVTYVTRQPIGVAALIAPWNVPLGLGMMKTAAALAFGCTVVLKPSELTPLTFPLVARLMKEAGLPDGAFNLVNGRGHVTGKALSEHPGIDCISFTGGTETGRAIGVAAAKAIIPTTMELGGKSANIVFNDADLDKAVEGSVLAAFAGNGQQCLAGSRILLQRGVAGAFKEKFLARVKAMKIGAPTAPDTMLGPIQNRRHMERILSFVERAKADGCTILTGGGRAPGFDRGFYIEPIVAEAPDNGRIICQEEIFGPFATILTFETTEEAVAIANDSPFGLVGYVWTKDGSKALSVANALQTGVVWVNTAMTRELRAPFGGWKESGVGREGGDACAALYTQEKTVTIRI
jgi:acyl-CoA reductase-like NAD-dependent aldehyde dehydrogenase